jgi:hypothetical protein
MANYITSGSLTNYVNTSTNQSISGKKSFTGGINTKSQIVAGATVLGNDILGGVVRVSGSGNINLPSPVDNAGGRISFYFESDCTLQTPSGVFTGTIATGGATLPITIASFGRHLECYSDGTNWIIMRSSGDVSSITATTLGLGNVANTRPSDLPISNAVSSAMTLKANLSGANFTGNITGITIHATTSLLVGGTNLSDIYLRTSNFNGSINNYLLTNNFTGSINNYLRTDNFTGSINNYLMN